MSDVVFILGAGASAEAGAPMMLDFLDVADRMLRRGEVPPATRQAFEDVAKGRAALDAVHAKATIDPDNLEDVFAAFEMSALFRRFGSMDKELVARLPASMRSVIVEVLEQSLVFSVLGDRDEPSPAAPGAYTGFASLVRELMRRKESASVVTFNYDMGVDYSLFREGFHIDYCLRDVPTHPGDPDSIDLLKLHGSLNWTACKQCGLPAYTFEQYFKDRRFGNWRSTSEIRFEFRDPLTRFNHCNAVRGPEQPAIIPPTWNKGVHHYPEIENVWRRAATHLAQARKIVVIGYSLPPTDQFFRYLYALGTLGETRLEQFLVVNPAKDAGIRFRQLLGRGVERRFMFRGYGFQAALTNLTRLLLMGSAWHQEQRDVL